MKHIRPISGDGPSTAMMPARLSARTRYRIENLTRRTILCPSASAACTFWRRLIGLLGRSSMAAEDALIFPNCNSVHTWFMRMPIDVLAIDRTGRVLRCEPALPPWRLLAPAARAWAIVELGPGSIAASATDIGDQLAIVSVGDEAPSRPRKKTAGGSGFGAHKFLIFDFRFWIGDWEARPALLESKIENLKSKIQSAPNTGSPVANGELFLAA